MEMGELFEVHAVARAMDVEHDGDEAGAGGVAADAAGRLNIFRRRLGLALHQHQPQAVDVEADRDHVGRQRHVDRFAGAVEAGFQPGLGRRDLIGRDA